MNDQYDFKSRLVKPLIVAVLLVVFGTVGFIITEGVPLLEALHLTVITISTVGSHEAANPSTAGIIFSMILIVCSVVIIAYVAGTLASFVVEGELNRFIKDRKMHKQIKDLSGHIILCGTGRTGSVIVEELNDMKVPIVIIEQNRERIEELKESLDDNFLFVSGDATTDATLELAGIKKAGGLIACLGSDRDNIFVVLSAKGLNDGLRIIARLDSMENEQKFIRAGADEVVSPNAIGGKRIASFITQPAAVHFLETVMGASDHKIHIQEVAIEKGSELADKTLAESHIGKKTNVLVLGIKDESGHYTFNPGGAFYLRDHNSLMVMGKTDEIKSLKEAASSSSPMMWRKFTAKDKLRSTSLFHPKEEEDDE